MNKAGPSLTYPNIYRQAPTDQLVYLKKGVVLNDSHVRIDLESDKFKNYWHYRVQGTKGKHSVVAGFLIQKDRVFADADIYNLVYEALKQGKNDTYVVLFDSNDGKSSAPKIE